MEYTKFREIADKDHDSLGHSAQETAETIEETLDDYECVKNHPEWEKVLIEDTPMAGNGFVCRNGAENE